MAQGMRNSVFTARYGGKNRSRIKQGTYSQLKELEAQKTAHRKQQIKDGIK